jgi:hypothetical protein
MEMSQLAMAVRRVVRQMERAQVQMTKKVVRSYLKGTRCRGRSGTTRCGITTTESTMYSRLKGLSRYMVRQSSSLHHVSCVISVLVDRPEKVDFESVRTALAHVVPLCLDGDPSLIPSSTKLRNGTVEDSEDDSGDPDDFRFWSARQAWRIARAVREMFGVEYAPDVVVADANLTALAQRIVASQKLMEGGDD